METYEAIKKRRSIRNYTSADIAEDDLRKIILAGAMAPSAHNQQPWQFIVIRDNEIQRRLMLGGSHREQLVKAPIVLAVCFETKADDYGIIDASLAAENIVIAAADIGISSCIVTSYLPDKSQHRQYEELKEILKVPKEIEVLLLIALGYLAEDPDEKRLKPFEDLIHFEKYGGLQYLKDEKE